MESTGDDTVNANFEHVLACLYAQKRMLAILFAASPDAMARLQTMDLAPIETHLTPLPVSDAFIERVKAEVTSMQTIARRALND